MQLLFLGVRLLAKDCQLEDVVAHEAVANVPLVVQDGLSPDTLAVARDKGINDVLRHEGLRRPIVGFWVKVLDFDWLGSPVLGFPVVVNALPPIASTTVNVAQYCVKKSFDFDVFRDLDSACSCHTLILTNP